MYARLCAAQASSHSLSRAVRPRRDIMVCSWQVLSCPETGSAVRARSLPSSRPRGCRRRRVARAVAGSWPGCLALRGAGLRPRPGSLASGASSRSLSWPARAEFSSLTYPEPASTVRSRGLIPARVSCSRQVPGKGAQWRAAGRVLGQHRAGDDLAGGDHGLAVAAGHVALLVAHHPHVRAGGVRPRPGAGPVRARRLTGPAAATPLPGRRGRVQASGLARRASRRAWSSAASRSRARASRSRRSARRASARGVAGCGLASSAASAAAAPARTFPICGSARFAFRAACGPPGDHPAGHVPHAPLPGHPAGPLTLAVPVQHQRDHHLRAGRRAAMPAGPVPAAEPAQIQGGHRVQHDEDQIVPGQPLAHARRHQQQLITLRAKETLRHTP
jgi:hypothetical protein